MSTENVCLIWAIISRVSSLLCLRIGWKLGHVDADCQNFQRCLLCRKGRQFVKLRTYRKTHALN